MPAFHKITSLAKEMDFPVHLLFINTPGGFTTSKELNYRILPYLEACGINEGPVVINAVSPADGISTYLEKHPQTIIGMITHGKTGISRIVSGSLVESIVNHIKAPVLSVKMA